MEQVFICSETEKICKSLWTVYVSREGFLVFNQSRNFYSKEQNFNEIKKKLFVDLKEWYTVRKR